MRGGVGKEREGIQEDDVERVDDGERAL